MTSTVNDLKQGVEIVKAHARVAGYKKGAAVFDLRAALSKRLQGVQAQGVDSK